MQMILHYPLPNKNCVIGLELTKDIVDIMHNILSELLKHLLATRFLTDQDLLVSLIMKSMMCTSLIKENQAFTQDQINYVSVHENIIKFRFYRMRTDLHDTMRET